MKGTMGGREGERGEIVQVQGGHILRSTGRKDRHSKVYTSKGPRDRRVRLSAHTAIQFYDVQDRLGYDRPSKAVDWLMNKAKNAIDKLHELPPWHPDGVNLTSGANSDGYPEFQLPDNNSNNNNNNSGASISSSSYIPHPPNEDSMKSLFPLNFPNFPNEPVQTGPFGDLGLSLHSNYRGNSSLNGPVQPFLENFQRMDGWNGGTAGIPINSMFSDQRELLIQSSGTVHGWNENNNHEQRPHLSNSDFGSSFELGFRIPARIYGDEDPHARNE